MDRIQTKLKLMGKKLFLLSIIPALLFSACKKSNNTIFSKAGLYKPYKQEISTIHARTKTGDIDGSHITLSQQSTGTNGTGNSGSIQFSGFDANSQPLREVNILIDSVRLTKDGTAYLYPNLFKIQRTYSEIRDSLFLIPIDTSIDFNRFYPCCSNPIVITDNRTANLYLTIRGALDQGGFVLFHYEIFIKTYSGTVYGTINANYLDLSYLTQQLDDKDTLVYVKKSTYFNKFQHRI